MILGAAFCPNPPLLVPEVAQGAAAELAQLRAACTAAITTLCDIGGQIAVLGVDRVSRSHGPHCRGSLAGYGVPLEVQLGEPGGRGPVDLPLSLTIGAWLLHEALGPRGAQHAYSIGPDFAASDAAAGLSALVEETELALLVMGDGSARLSTSAPGYLDERAQPFDRGVSAALAGGSPAALRELDADLAVQLLSEGVPAWHLAGLLLDGQDYRAQLLADTAPYGVGYFVASWTRA